MKDLSRPQKTKKYEPNGVELIALALTISVWVYIIVGAMI